jgi:hypothetical protein
VRKDVVNVFKVAGYITSRIKDGAGPDSRKYSAYGFHSLRHAIFSFLCQRGITIERLKAWSGDSEKTLLKYYLHAETEKLITDANEALTFNGIIDVEPQRSLIADTSGRAKLLRLVQALPDDKIALVLEFINKEVV